MNRWHRQFLGSTSLSVDLTDFELEHFFTLSANERATVLWIRGSHFHLQGVGFLGTTPVAPLSMEAVGAARLPGVEEPGCEP